jgi:beta-phosphoglucomutase-like phosphatase (HAD superfamily)
MAAKLQTLPRKFIVFEDSVAGVQAANIGNMTSIGIEKHLRCMKQNISLKILPQLIRTS